MAPYTHRYYAYAMVWLLCGLCHLVAVEAAGGQVDVAALRMLWIQGNSTAVINQAGALLGSRSGDAAQVCVLYVMAKADVEAIAAVRKEFARMRGKMPSVFAKDPAWLDIAESACLRAEGKYTESALLAQSTLLTHPSYDLGIPAAISLARSLELLAKYPEAIDAYKQAIRLEKAASSADHPLAGIINDRIDDIRESLRFKDKPDEAFYQRGMRAYQASRYAPAEVAFTALIQRYPTSGRVDEAGYWLGMSLLGQEKIQEAIDILSAFVLSKPSGAFRGQARIALYDYYLERRVDLDRAMEYATGFQPGSDRSWEQAMPLLTMRMALGLYLVGKGEEAKAALSSLSAAQLAGQVTSGSNGWLPPPTPASLLLDKVSKGIPLLGSVKLSNDKRLNLLATLSEAYWTMQQYGKAAALIAMIHADFEPQKIPKDIREHVAFRLADCGYWQSDYKRAMALYGDFMADYPNGKYAPEVLLRMGVLQYTRFHDAESAMQTFATIEKRFAGHELAATACVYTALCQLWSGNERLAIAHMQRIKRQYPTNEWATVSIEDFVKQASIARDKP